MLGLACDNHVVFHGRLAQNILILETEIPP